MFTYLRYLFRYTHLLTCGHTVASSLTKLFWRWLHGQSFEDWRCDGELRQLKVDPSTMSIEDALLYKSSEQRISLLYHSLCVQSFEGWSCDGELRQLKVDPSTMSTEDALLYKSSEQRISLLYHSLCVQSFEDWRCGGKGSLRWTI